MVGEKELGSVYSLSPCCSCITQETDPSILYIRKHMYGCGMLLHCGGVRNTAEDLQSICEIGSNSAISDHGV